MYVIIVGSGHVSFHLANDLLGKDHEVTIIDPDEAMCDRARERLECSAIHGTGTDPLVLEEAGLMRADALVACTSSDEDNLVSCHLAEALRPEIRTVALAHDPKNEEVFRHLGIDSVVGSTTTLSNIIEHELPAPEVFTLLSLKRGGMQIVEAELDADAPCIGASMQELKLPKGTLAISVVRDNEVVIPHGGTVIESGDVLIALVQPDDLNALRDILFGH